LGDCGGALGGTDFWSNGIHLNIIEAANSPADRVVALMSAMAALHKTVLDEFYRIAFRKRLYASIGDLQDDLDPWDEIREKIFKNYALKSIDAVRTKLKEAILYIERNPETVKSITSFPYILKSPLMWIWYEAWNFFASDKAAIASITFREWAQKAGPRRGV